MRAESCCPSLEVMAISRDGRNVTSHSAASYLYVTDNAYKM